MKTNMKELNMNEMEQASGGILPIIVMIAIGVGGAGLIGYGIKKGKDDGWK